MAAENYILISFKIIPIPYNLRSSLIHLIIILVSSLIGSLWIFQESENKSTSLSIMCVCIFIKKSFHVKLQNDNNLNWKNTKPNLIIENKIIFLCLFSREILKIIIPTRPLPHPCNFNHIGRTFDLALSR